MKKNYTTLLLGTLFLIFGFLQPVSAVKTFVHPGIPFTQADLDLLKINISQEPWKTGYQALAADNHSKLTYGMQGPYATVSRAPNLYNTAWQNDMVAIHNLTFMWVFTGNDAYAAKATDILDKWAVTNTAWEGNENMLDIGDYISYLVPAADILKSSYSGWTANNTTHVNSYFANVLYPTSGVPAVLRDNNKGALQLKIALSIAAFLDDEAKWNDAIETYRIDGGSGLRCSLSNGETGDTGRDDHWFVQAYALSWGAEVAWKQGVDMYAELDNRLHEIGELYNHYSINPTDLKFIPFGGSAAYWTTWGIAPGVQHGEPLNNIIHSAYALRKGIATPYTDQMRTLVGTENALSFLYNKSADASTATALTPIVFPATEVASRLTNVDIGNTGIAGNVTFNNGKWQVTGAGTSVAGAVNYTFKPVHGDFSIIAKVEGNTISSAIAGVMVRESLSTSANNISVNLYDGSVNAKYNGTINGYTHYIPTAPWWLKLERIGNRIFSYHSADGVNWSNHNQIISSIATDAYVGLFTLSNNTSVLNTTTFSNVSITNTSAVGAPEITSATTLSASLTTALNYTVTASVAPTGFSASGLPAGLTIDAVTGVISGTPTTIGQYVVTLGATNANGTGNATLILNVINNTAPAAVTGLSASVVNSTKISLSWTASANATSYTVKKSLTPGGPYSTIQSGITGTTFIDAAPEYEVKNYYIVTAICGDMESVSSSEVNAATAPAVPSNLVAASKSGGIDLTWDVAPGALSYKIKRSTVSGGPYTQVATVSTSSYTDVDVTNGSAYYYVISSMGKTLESVNTAEVFGTPGSTNATWSATPTSGIFNLSSNWVENTVPATPAVMLFNASATKSLTNDMVGLEATRIEFSTTAGGYKIAGNSLVLKNDLVNNSAAADTLTMPVALNNQLNVYTKTSSIRLSGIVSGAGGILKRGTSALYLTGNNTYSGNTIVTGTTGYKWGSTDGVIITGIGTGVSGSPLSGPLGTGKVILNGGAISSDLVTDAATLYNDIEVPAGQSGYFYERKGALNFYGRLTGGGTIYNDGSDNYAALQLFGDNSSFTGTFISKLRSGNHRLAFMTPQAGSANANWLLDANGNDCQRLLMTSGTLRFGSLSGRGLIRNDIAGSMIISIGALNANANYSGTISQANAANIVGVEKVGTGVQTFSGNNTYAGATTIQNGTFLLNNNATTGAFTSPITVNAGAFGGYGKASSSIVVGTGVGIGAAFVPGTDGAVGTFTTTGLVTLNADASFKVDVNSATSTCDKVVANGITLNNAVLSVANVGAGSIPIGTNFLIADNTGANAITGRFKDLAEGAAVMINGAAFKITYVGGTGNDIVLLDNRTPIVTSVLSVAATVDVPFSYAVIASNSPLNYSITGLPAGLSIDAATGAISGTPTVTGTFASTLSVSNVIGVSTITLTVTVAKQAQTITFDAITGKTIGDADFDPAAISNSGLAIAYTSSNPVVATVVEGKIHIVSVGTSEITASQAGNDVYNVATSVVQTLNVGKKDQTISFAALPAKTFGDGDFAFDASSTSGLVVDVVSSNPDVATLVDGKIHILKAGTVTFTALQLGNENYNAAGSVDQVLVVGKKDQTISFAALPAKTFGDGDFAFDASSTSGLVVDVVSSNPDVATVVAGKIHILKAGTVTFTASQVGSENYNAAGSVDQVLVVGKKDQTISFAALPAKTFGDGDFAFDASSTSGLVVDVVSSNPDVATVVAGKIHILKTGTVTFTALQLGNENYNAAGSVDQVLVVGKKDQTISFAALPAKTFGDGDFAFDASSTSGLVVDVVSSNPDVATVVAGKIHILKTGTVTFTASQVGSENYNAAGSVDQVLVVGKKDQTITFATLPIVRKKEDDFAIGAFASSNLAILYTSSDSHVATIIGDEIHIVHTGTTIITANQTGDTNYNPAKAVSQTLTVVASINQSEEINRKEVTVYPTLVSENYFNVKIPEYDFKSAKITIYSLLDVVMKKKLESNFETINVSRLAPGHYLVEVNVDGEITVKRIIKK